MNKFMRNAIVSCPIYISQRENYLGKKNTWFQDPSSFLSNRLNNAECLYSKNLSGHSGCINAVEFSENGKYLISGGDDRCVLLWNINEAIDSGKSTRMKTQHQSNVFCLAFDSMNSKILSAGNDGQILVHDTKTGDILDIYLQEMALYGLSVCPNNDSMFVSAAEDGKIRVFDMKSRGAEPTMVAHTYNSFHAVQFHPLMTNFIISANNAEGFLMWDMRNPKRAYRRYGGRSCKEAMSVKFNKDGSKLLGLIRRSTPILFDTITGNKLATFDGDYYYNSCTMKSCCFAGPDDEYVLSGSDDFNLYMWKIPEVTKRAQFNRKPHMILKGHRSIVNQVRFNKNNFLIASSGVEKIVKLWSPLPLPHCNGGISANDSQLAGRQFFTQREYLGRFGENGRNFGSELDGTEEDLSMLAFFDALVHREISDIHSPWILSDQSSESDEWSEPHVYSDSTLSPSPSLLDLSNSSPRKSLSVDEMLPRLIASRRHKLRLKEKLEKKFSRHGVHRRRVKLSGLSTANNVRYIYDPNEQDWRQRLDDESIPQLSFTRRFVAPYTVMEDDNSSDISADFSSSSDNSTSSSDEAVSIEKRCYDGRKAYRRSKKRPCRFVSSDDESVSPKPKRKALLSPDLETKDSDAEISGIISSEDDKDLTNSRSEPISERSNTCCQGTGCSSKCRRFVPISSISNDEDEDIQEYNTGRKGNERGSSSAETADSGVSLNSMASSSSGGAVPSTSTAQDDNSSRRIKFSTSKAKNARQRCYRGQM